MKILYIGDGQLGCTSLHRAEALRRLGHDVTMVSTDAVMAIESRLGRIWHYRTGYTFKLSSVHRAVRNVIGNESFDIGWINGGECVGSALLAFLRDRCRYLVNYNNDDPTGDRDGMRWLTLRRCIKRYDVSVVVRSENVAEYEQMGARKVIRVYRSYDPVAHARLALSAHESEIWSSRVLFLGTWMPERGPFMKRLIELGVPLTIRGDRWQKAREWPFLKPYVASSGLYGRDYVAGIQSAQICLGLVSKENRDLHTQRSAEIPYIGTALCAERTSEHESMFTDNRDAVLWSSAEECAAHCHRLLADRELLGSIAAAGHARILAARLSNDAVIEDIISKLRE